MSLTLWRGPDTGTSTDDDVDGAERTPAGFAAALAVGLADLSVDDLADGSLVLELSVSTWIRRTGLGLATARLTMFSLRRALLSATDLDTASEPVPLAAGDPRACVVGLARYLWDMIDRAARVTLIPPAEVANRALGHLELADVAQTG